MPKRKHKNTHGAPKGRGKLISETSQSIPPVIAVAAKIAGLNARQGAIATESGKLNERLSRLSAEWQGNERRKLELMREFDSAAK